MQDFTTALTKFLSSVTAGARESQETCSIVEDLHKEENTCADLEGLQRKALSISLSSISGMRKIGEGTYLMNWPRGLSYV